MHGTHARPARPPHQSLMSVLGVLNGMSLMSCNDLPVYGPASALPLRLSRLTMVWTLLETIRLHFASQAGCERSSDTPRGAIMTFPLRKSVSGRRHVLASLHFHLIEFLHFMLAVFIDEVAEISRGWSATCPGSGAVPGPERLPVLDRDLLVTPL